MTETKYKIEDKVMIKKNFNYGKNEGNIEQ